MVSRDLITVRLDVIGCVNIFYEQFRGYNLEYVKANTIIIIVRLLDICNATQCYN